MVWWRGFFVPVAKCLLDWKEGCEWEGEEDVGVEGGGDRALLYWLRRSHVMLTCALVPRFEVYCM